MKTILIFCLSLSALSIMSCQKELSYTLGDPAGSNNGNGNTGSSNGDLLVKALQISPATNDTNTITFQWDASKRLTQYTSQGKVQGIAVAILHVITRDNSGKITKILSKSAMPNASADSAVYWPAYVTGTSKLAYVKAKEYGGFLGDVNDSAVYVYNAAGQVIQREIFSDFLGTMAPTAKNTFTYDANSNLLVNTQYNADFLTGVYTQSAATTNTYGTHKAGITMGEEAMISLDPANVSKNEMVKQVTNAVQSGSTYTSTFSEQQYSSFDRPTKATINVTPQPPGYTMKLTYFYQ